MNDEERQRMNWLCQRIQEEQDHNRFSELIAELNELLARQEERLSTNREKA
ncbi:MAG TPA: hypothetical protein VMF10_13805 [Candidatus Aquilonibacter sp.]|nr:hypothetical protein [Candidatus Aquilonibacter sp.]